MTPGGGFLESIRGADPEDAPVDEGRVRASFLLFSGGAALALMGAALVAVGQLYPWTPDISMRWILRLAGGVALGMGGTGLMLGLVTALMPEGWIRWTAAAGAVTSLAGVGGFAYAYPWRWGVGNDLSLPVIGLLVLGYGLLAGATLAALAANLVLRRRVRETLRDELDREPTDAEVARDVEEALRDSSWTWGGVRKDDTKGVKVASARDTHDDLELHGWKLKMDVEEDDGGRLDQSVTALSALRGGNEQTGDADLEGAGSKSQRLAEVKARGPPEPGGGTQGRWSRFRTWLGDVF